jgi:hypothetical protein
MDDTVLTFIQIFYVYLNTRLVDMTSTLGQSSAISTASIWIPLMCGLVHRLSVIVQSHKPCGSNRPQINSLCKLLAVEIQVLHLNIVDNSAHPFRPDSRSFLRRSRAYDSPHAADLVRHSPNRAALGLSGPVPHTQATPSGSGRSGTVSRSHTVQRRFVSPAAIAGVRCRYRWGMRRPPRSIGRVSASRNDSCGRTKW